MLKDIKCLISSLAKIVLLCGLVALPLHATNYFVQSGGDDGGVINGVKHDGTTMERAWKTVAYAAKNAKAAGDTILVGDGIFAETEEILLAPKVNLIGLDRTKTTITIGERLASVGKKLLVLRSEVVTPGQQTISHLTLDGKKQAAPIGIHLKLRDGVTIHDVTVQDCGTYGVLIEGRGFEKGTFTWPENMPPAEYWVSHLEIYNSTFLNSGRVEPGTNWAYGAITVYELKDSIIRNCTFDESVYGGFNLKGTWGSNLSIHDNIWRVAAHWPNNKSGKAFGFEYWFMASCRVYNNWSNGALSIFASNSEIYDNEIVMPPDEGSQFGIEINGPDTHLRRNYVDGAVPGIVYWGEEHPNLFIEQNVLRGGGIFISSGYPAGQNSPQKDYHLKNIFIYNNTIDLAKTIYGQGGAIGARVQTSGSTIEGLEIRNNIISNPANISAISLTGSNGGESNNINQIVNPIVTNNLFFNTPKDTPTTPPGDGEIRVRGTVNVVKGNNLSQTDPRYAGGELPYPYYGLRADSPAINAGTKLPGLTYSGAAPDIGAYEAATMITRLEAESFEPAGSPRVRNRAEDSGTSVSIYTKDDKVIIPFTVTANRICDLKVRVRSGAYNWNNNQPLPTLYWPNGYRFFLDGAPVTLVGDPNSVSVFDSGDGGIYWGTMQKLSVPLSSGNHTIQVMENGTYEMVDYFELVE